MSEQRPPVLTGGCQCGAIRYALYTQPDRAGICHCRMCQKAVGSPFNTWANVRVENFAWTRGRPATFRSSSAAGRGFCPRCGTPLCFAYVKRPEVDQHFDRQPRHSGRGAAHPDRRHRRPTSELRPSGARQPAGSPNQRGQSTGGPEPHRQLPAPGSRNTARLAPTDRLSSRYRNSNPKLRSASRIRSRPRSAPASFTRLMHCRVQSIAFIPCSAWNSRIVAS